MANDLKRVGLVFTSEGAVDFKKTMQEINLALNENYNQFKKTQSQWDSSTSSTEKLRKEQEYLKNAYDLQTDKVNALKMELAELESAENKNTTAIRKKRNELTNAEIKLDSYNQKLKEIDTQLNSTGKRIQEYGEKISNTSKKISDVGNKMSVASAAVAAGGTILASGAMSLEDAVAKYMSSTNVAESETEKYKQVLEDINKNNYGEGYEDIANSMSQVTMQLKDLNAQDLQNITEKAIALRDLFGYDVSESIRAVKAMMDNLNVSADEAFELIAQGKKQGLDFSNELLDNINEYSIQFGKLGLSAEDMFNIFKTGADNGAFNLDKIGDAIKEFSIRAIDGSDTTADGFERIGLSADKMAKKFANGGDTAKQAFIEVVKRLGNMDDKVSQSIAGVDLFGTMWEDLGPTVITSFSNMDAGISKSSKSMEKSIDQLYNTTKQKAETQLRRLQSLGADFGEEMLPILEDLIDMAEGFTDKLEGMSDAEKENIVKIGLFVAGLGPFVKIMGTAGQAVGKVTSGIGLFSQALEVSRGKTEATSKSVENMASVLTMLQNPYVLLTSAILAGGAAIAYFGAKEIEEAAALNGVTESLENQKISWDNLQKTREEMLDASSSEIAMIQRLSDELSKIVEENGKIKSGYEARAKTIVGELNSALGTEYSINGNIIQQYGTMQGEIQKLINVKKAEAALNAYQGEYAEALKEQSAATEQLVSLKEQLNQKTDELVTATGKERQDIIRNMNDITQKMGEQQEKISQYGYTIQNYENLQTASASGTADAIDDAVNRMSISWDRAQQANTESIESQVTSQAEYVANLKGLLEEAELAHDTYSQNILTNQLETEEKQLNSLVESMVQQTSTVNELSTEQIEAWKSLADNNFSAYNAGLSLLPIETQNKITEATGVITLNTSAEKAASGLAERMSKLYEKSLRPQEETREEVEQVATEMNKDTTVEQAGASLASKASSGFNNNVDGKTWGKDLASEISSGLTSSSSQKKVSSAAGLVASLISSFLHFSLPDEGPLSDADTYMPDMIDLLTEGIKKNKKKLVNEVSNMSREMSDELQNEQEASGINYNSTYSRTRQTNINNQSDIIDYDRLYKTFLRALTDSKIKIDKDGLIKIIDDRLMEVM